MVRLWFVIVLSAILIDSSMPTPISRLSRSSKFSRVFGSSDLPRKLKKLKRVSGEA